MKISIIVFHENAFSRSRVIPHRWTDGLTTGRRTDMIVALGNFTTTPNNEKQCTSENYRKNILHYVSDCTSAYMQILTRSRKQVFWDVCALVTVNDS
jgi:hypothetical protein